MTEKIYPVTQGPSRGDLILRSGIAYSPEKPRTVRFTLRVDDGSEHELEVVIVSAAPSTDIWLIQGTTRLVGAKPFEVSWDQPVWLIYNSHGRCGSLSFS